MEITRGIYPMPPICRSGKTADSEDSPGRKSPFDANGINFVFWS